MEKLGATLLWILAGMAALSALEALAPLRAGGRRRGEHLAPNLVLSALTLLANAPLDAGLALALQWLARGGHGVLRGAALPPCVATAATLLALDLSFYASHVAMHRIPRLWRFHRVHHADPQVDVTTTLRQHPGEGLFRWACLAAVALPLGASPSAVASYRLLSAFSGLLEHANLRVPRGLDRALSVVFTWPGFHKLHHARDARFTDTNYGNLFSWWDRLFRTARRAPAGAPPAYGLDGLDAPALQTARGLLVLPFRGPDPVAAPRPRAPLGAS